MKTLACVLMLTIISTVAFTGDNVYQPFAFLLGEWQGTGSGFGNAKSKICAEFKQVMNGKYLEVKHDSKFEPTEKNPEGENHIDWGMISFDKSRKCFIYRQFNIEGYVNQYVMNDSLSNDSTLIFETETIENFVEGGRARFTIKKISQNEIETVFDVSFPGREFACFGTNRMIKNF